jgi:flagellar motor protein MotB
LSRYGKVSGHTHTSIYKELEKNFAKEIKSEQLLLKKDLSLTLYDSTLHFDIGVSTLNTKQKNLIKSIKPRLLKILDHYHDRIENLSINGHTSSVWNDYKFEKRYLKNMKLSTERAYNTLEVLFKSNSKKDMKLLSELLQSSGNAYKKTIIKKGKEDKKASQRVVIQIELKE